MTDELEKQQLRKYYDDQRQHDKYYESVKNDIVFKSIFVKKAQSRQTGEKTVFYDIDLVKYPDKKMVGQYIHECDKYNKILGISFNLSLYANFKRNIQHNLFMSSYYIPALERAYEEYLQENYYGKEIDFEESSGCIIKAKAFQIDWFDEVYKADEKILTSFQKTLQNLKDKYNVLIYNCPELEDWELAWVDYVERYDIHSYLYDCRNMITHPNKYSHIKDTEAYVRQAEKILHRKII